MNAVVELKQGALATSQAQDRMAVADIMSHVAMVQTVMRNVMKENVHYGRIPGAGDKPTLLKAGAELLCMTFRVADKYMVEDLSTPDMIRYRVTCIGEHQTSGMVLGSGLGEASSSEEKYKWRKSVCDEEWNDAPPNLRRSKYAKAKGGGFYVQKQVRTEPADLANTVLKMANKRAKIAMTLNVTAASDMFSQDLEDMEEALREHLARGGEEAAAVEQPAAPPTWPEDVFAKQLPKFHAAIAKGKTADEIIAWAETKGALTEAQKTAIRTPATEAAAGPTYAALADRMAKCADQDTATLILDEGRALPPDQQADLQKLFDGKFSQE